MKENLEAFVASIGCLPILAIALFLAGALIGELADITAPAPSQWLLVPVVLLPIFTTLYLRTYHKQKRIGRWFDLWREVARKKVVGHREGHSPQTVEELWLEEHVPHSPHQNPVHQILDNTALWGWAAFICFLALAYIFIWLGLMVAGP